MKLNNSELKKNMRELQKAFSPKSLNKIQSHLISLERQIEDLIESRDNWKNKYMDLKNA